MRVRCWAAVSKATRTILDRVSRGSGYGTSDHAYEVDVVIEADGESVFSATYQVGTTPDTANINVDSPVDGPGQYVIRATMDGETRDVDIAEYVDGDENCVGVRFSLLDDGSVYHWTRSMQQCWGSMSTGEKCRRVGD